MISSILKLSQTLVEKSVAETVWILDLDFPNLFEAIFVEWMIIEYDDP